MYTSFELLIACLLLVVFVLLCEIKMQADVSS